MPRISAATVAEHHANQRAALLRAAMAALGEDGTAAVTPAEVGRRAGLARSSVYQYFPSTAALVAAVVEEAFPPWNREVAEELAGVVEPRERIARYVSVTLRMTAEGRHRAAGALLGADLPAECRARAADLHRETIAPLAAAVAELEPVDPGLSTRLIGGLLTAAMHAVEAGTPAEDAQARLFEVLGGRFAVGPGAVG